MARAVKICSDPTCNERQPCPTHKPEPWSGSRRRTRIGISGSTQQKFARWVLERDEGKCHVCGEYGADQADHVIPVSEGGDPGVDNMAAIHAEPCHRVKTAEEAKRARGVT